MAKEMAKVALVLEAHRGPALAVAFSPDEKTLYTGGDDKLVCAFEVGASGKGERIAKLTGHTAPVATLAYDTAGERLASGSQDEVRLWDSRTNKLAHEFKGESLVAFGPAGHHLATIASLSIASKPAAPGDPVPGARVTLWDARELSVLRHIDPLDRRHTALCFAPNGSLLFVGGSGRIHRIALPDGTSEGVQSGHQIAVSHIRPSPNEAVFGSTGMDGTLFFWTVVGGDEVNSISLATSPGPGGFPLSFGPDGRKVAVGCGNSVRIYTAPDGVLQKEIPAHAEVHDVAVSPSGRWVANALANGSVHVHEI